MGLRMFKYGKALVQREHLRLSSYQARRLSPENVDGIFHVRIQIKLSQRHDVGYLSNEVEIDAARSFVGVIIKNDYNPYDFETRIISISAVFRAKKQGAYQERRKQCRVS